MNYTVPGRPPQFSSPVPEMVSSPVDSNTENNAPLLINPIIVKSSRSEDINIQPLSMPDNSLPPASFSDSQQDQTSIKHQLSCSSSKDDDSGLSQVPEEDTNIIALMRG